MIERLIHVIGLMELYSAFQSGSPAFFNEIRFWKLNQLEDHLKLALKYNITWVENYWTKQI